MRGTTWRANCKNVSRIALQPDGFLKSRLKWGTIYPLLITVDLKINVHREIGVPLAYKWYFNLSNEDIYEKRITVIIYMRGWNATISMLGRGTLYMDSGIFAITKR